MQRIIFDYINTDYAYGKYGDFTVIMMTSNRYINATKLCKQYGKEFKHWKENIGNKQLIEEVEKEINDKSFIIKTGGKNELLRGTYVHEKLMNSIIEFIIKSRNIQRELNIVDKMNIDLNGQREVITSCGRIDILTKEQIIEVKEYKGWKAALGQILVYGNFYPEHQKRIHLFNIPKNNIELDIIKEIYNKYDVILTY
jgi:hypothetical protein